MQIPRVMQCKSTRENTKEELWLRQTILPVNQKATGVIIHRMAVPGSNEATSAEISGDRLMLNARNQKGDLKARIVAISADGGACWNNQFYDEMLPDPVCQGSILNIGEYNGKSILAFSNPADTADRNNLTLRFSYDDGESWDHTILIDKTADIKKKDSYTAYSDIVSMSHGRIGILYERDNYSEIVFKTVKPKSKY